MQKELERKFLALAEKFLARVKELHEKHGEDCSIDILIRSNEDGLGGQNGIYNR